MAQWVKCLPWNPEELSSYPKLPHKKPGVVKHANSPSAGLKETEGFLGVALASSVRNPSSKKKKKVRSNGGKYWILTSGFPKYLHTHVSTHV